MKLTNILALLTATVTTGVQAMPSSSLSERQALIAYIRFYAGNGCEEPWLEDTVFQQGEQCLANTYAGPYGSFNVLNNSFTRTSTYSSRDIFGGSANMCSPSFRQPGLRCRQPYRCASGTDRLLCRSDCVLQILVGGRWRGNTRLNWRCDGESNGIRGF